MIPVEQKQEEQNERIIRLLEQQLAQSNRQIEALTEQVRQLTKALYGSKSEKSKYQAPDGQVSLFEDARLLTNLSRQRNKAQIQLVIRLFEKRQIKNEMIRFARILKSKKFTIIRPI